MILSVFLLMVAAQQPGAAEQQAVLERLRDYAENYISRLQNFTCTKKTERTGDRNGKGQWKPLETKEELITFLNRKETHRVVRVTRAAEDRDFTTINGEFSGIANIFDSRVHADLRWDHAEGEGVARSCIFQYRVAANSGGGMSFVEGTKRTVLAHHGPIYANCETGEVTRLVIEVEPDPLANPPREARIDILYGPVPIGNKSYLLPTHASDTSLQNKWHTKAEVTFENYRKYDADSTIHFDSADQ